MNVPRLRSALLGPRALVLGTAAWMAIAGSYAQTKSSVMTLVKPEVSESRMAALPASERAVQVNAPVGFYHFGALSVGDRTPNVQRFTVEFAATAKITKIGSSPAFKVQPESSCAVGRTYSANSSCVVSVRFTPQGAGRQLGKLSISQDQTSEVVSMMLAGYSYTPVVSFVPSVIRTVPKTGTAGAGVFNAAQNLALAGDTLLVADTGNNKVVSIDSGGAPITLASGFSAPWGITADTFGEIYFSRPAANALQEIYDYGPVVTISGSGTGGCPASAPCTLSSHLITKPGEMSMDSYNNMFFTEQSSGGAYSTVQPTPADLIFLYDPFPYQTVTQGPAAMDAGDNIYSFWETSGNCEIVQQSLYNAENNLVSFTKVAGGHTCGFNGDGGLATNAQLGNQVGQIAFDAAGNMYFTDAANQRVRRIDALTGIIRTIAGNGTAGYTGDSSRATDATLASPTGVGVDSQGQVYILSGAATTGTSQVVRKIASTGLQIWPGTVVNTQSAVETVLVSNTGNNTLYFTAFTFNGTNPTDYKLDPSSTSCAVGTPLSVGASCQIGLIFAPTATGVRRANFNLVDNTVNFVNTVNLVASGVAAAAVKFVSPAANKTFSVGSSIPVSVNVTSNVGAIPTGTVKFAVDGKTVGSAVTLVSGTATTSLSSFIGGAHTITATYSGNSVTTSAKASQAITIVAASVQ